MKKRAQQPNAQTFTIIFRGCALSQHPKVAVSEAVKLYQNMLSVGRIKPNTIHLNAVLQVCAKASDLESMFSILTSSDDPLRSPNNLTYTTILNALRRKTEDATFSGNPFTRLQDKEVESPGKSPPRSTALDPQSRAYYNFYSTLPRTTCYSVIQY